MSPTPILTGVSEKMKTSGTMMQVSIVVLMATLLGLGAGGLYVHTSSTASPLADTSYLTADQISQNEKADPGGKYLGFIPEGYTVAPLLPNVATYPCPANFASDQCTGFQASCGNGVCDPNETCSTCPIDCGTPQGLSCDPYTGRASGLGGICELMIPYTNVNPAQANPTLTPPTTPGSLSDSP